MLSVIKCNSCGMIFNAINETDCPSCHSGYTSFYEDNSGCMDYSVLRDYISAEDKAKNYPGKINEFMQKNGMNGGLHSVMTITRIGGEDHNPEHRVEIDLCGVVGCAEGFFSKKDCSHVAALDWFEKYQASLAGKQ